MKYIDNHRGRTRVLPFLGVTLLVFMALLFSLEASAVPTNSEQRKAIQKVKKDSKTDQGSFDKPDFSFPKTVLKNARLVLDRSLKEDKPERAFKALLEICSAESKISTASADRCVSLIDSTANLLPAGWKSLAYMLEATLVGDVYDYGRYTYNDRQLPPSEVPEKMELWDAAMFKNKVRDLIGKSLAEAPAEMSLKPFASVLDPNKFSDEFLLTDFIYNKGLAIWDYFREFVEADTAIPFKVIGAVDESPSQEQPYQEILIAGWEGTLTPNSSPVRWSLFLKERLPLLSTLNRARYLRDLQSLFAETPLEPLLLVYRSAPSLSNGVPTDPLATTELKEFFDPHLLVKVLQKTIREGEFGEIDATVWDLAEYGLRDNLNRLTEASVAISSPSYILPGTEAEVKVTTHNLANGFVLLYKLHDNFPKDKTQVNSIYDLKNSTVIDRFAFAAKSTELPFEDELTITLPPLEPGRYCLVPSRSLDTKDLILPPQNEYLHISVINVTDLASFQLNVIESRPSEYIVNGSDGKPIADASVTLKSTNNRVPFTRKLTTDVNGAITVPDVPERVYGLSMYARKGKSDYSTNLYNISTQPFVRESTENMARILFDRAIARPGDEVSFSAIVWGKSGKTLSPLTGQTTKFVLRNASNVPVDTVSLTTDSYGRCHGKFQIPNEGMLGEWRLEATDITRNEWDWPSATIRVEEYKQPLNRLLLNAPETPNDTTLVLSGKVETYSGMPVADAKVTLSLETWSRWWWIDWPSGSFSTETNTDSNGNFRVELSSEGLVGTRYQNASFNLKATSVSTGGDVAEDSRMFGLGKTSVIVPEIPEKLEVTDDNVKLTVRVFDDVGNPQRKELRYTLTNVSEPSNQITGEFTSPLLEIPADRIPSGTYEISFEGMSKEEVFSQRDAKETFTVWRKGEKTVPGIEPIWVPETQVIASKGKSKVKVSFGSRYEGQNILCVVSNERSVLSRQWIKMDGKMTSIEVPAPGDTERIFVSFTTIRNFKTQTERVTVFPAIENERLEVKVETFRDKLASGSPESWRFRFTHGTKEGAGDVAAMSVMTDKALDALVPFTWVFNPMSDLRWYPACNIALPSYGSLFDKFNAPNRLNLKNSSLDRIPELWLYPPFIHQIRIRGTRRSLTGSVARAEADGAIMVMESAVFDEAKMAAPTAAANDVLEEAAVEYGAGGSDESTVTYRESECPVAFFRPMLTTAEDGTLSIDFEVPDFNTTWKFQLLGYDKRMDAASLQLEAVSTKPVMVSASLPRFVRTGDKVILTATAFNNSDSTLALGGSIEILDPVTMKVIASRQFEGVETAPAGSRLLSIDFDVPSDLSAVIVRSRAVGNGHSDGEQSLLEILPSSSPVIEATDFYLTPGEKEFSIEIPKLRKDSAVTLMYCDNPAWYCLTALPALADEKGSSLTSLLYAYYGNAIGTGLLKARPQLRKGLEEMTRLQAEGETDILTSNLERNASMKVVNLGSTPWVNSAAAESARMGTLVNLLDDERARKVLDGLLAKIYALQASDGGMRWYPGSSETSYWCTGQTLLHFSMLNRFGYLPAEDARVKSIVNRGTKYCQSEILERWHELVKLHGDSDKTLSMMLGTMTNYLYIRSQFEKSPLLPTESAEFAKLARRSVNLIMNSWKDMGIYNAATAAVLLADRGEKKVSETILESLSQRAMTSPRRGMWYDNLPAEQFSPWNNLITTAQVLEAFTDIKPKAPEVDRLRQWLLLQRQAENWGRMRDAAELVQAILASGTNWTGTSERRSSFKITAGGETLLESKKLPSYGEMVVSLKPEEVSGKTLTITRDGKDIAWGGVVEQYVAPMADIKAASLPELSIEKSIFVLRTEKGVEKAIALNKAGELKVGDKVRVLLTVDCDRDMEYVVVTDERGACLEPVDPLSGIDVVDGRFVYREVRNSDTNFFFSYLAKGRYQFSYDCHLTSAGTFAAGIATFQSQYAPQLTAHSAAVDLKVK